MLGLNLFECLPLLVSESDTLGELLAAFGEDCDEPSERRDGLEGRFFRFGKGCCHGLNINQG